MTSSSPRPPPARPGRMAMLAGALAIAATLTTALATTLAGCSRDGSLQSWREIRPPGWGIAAALPCRPAQHRRTAMLAGASVEWSLWSCDVDGTIVAVGSGDVGDPSRVAPALGALVDAARSNLRASAAASRPASVPGMTPQAAALEVELAGSAPDGRALRERMVVFAAGTRIVQATVVGTRADDALARPLFDALAVRP